MDQSRALNALAPFLALAKSATSPRAAADLVTQATSAPNTYVFAELLQHPNVRALAEHEQYGAFYELLRVFAWGTWGSYKDGVATHSLPPLSDAQALKLRLLSLLTLASGKHAPPSASESPLSYSSLCAQLDLASPLDLEHLVTQAIYNDLISASLNPASQTVVVRSVAPLRDLAPGSVASMIAELTAWSGRCDAALAGLQAEIAHVKSDARKRALKARKTEKQVKAATEASEKAGAGGAGGVLGSGRTSHNARGPTRRPEDEGGGDDDFMDVDSGSGVSLGGGGKKRSGGSGLSGIKGKLGGHKH